MRRLMCGVMVAVVLGAGPVWVEAAQEPEVSGAQRASVELVDLNEAGAVELETLPGVGERTAARIIEYRQENGGFKKIEELMNVRGIGEISFLKLRPLVTVGTAKPDAGARD